MEMEMNSRQFDAAHDRYLEPPDDDGEETWDEMDLADIRKQEQRDREDFEALGADYGRRAMRKAFESTKPKEN
jgi:hypothetical protein